MNPTNRRTQQNRRANELINAPDEEIFRKARLAVCAIVAKIHTIDWTVELLKTSTLRIGMRANWYGIFGESCPSDKGHYRSHIIFTRPHHLYRISRGTD